MYATRIHMAGATMVLLFERSTLKLQNGRPRSRAVKQCAVEARGKAACSLDFAWLALALLLAPLLGAQQKEPASASPPGSSAGLSTAQNIRPRVFISAPNASGSRAHNVLYGAIMRSGEYELVNDPAQADQIFEANITRSWRCEPFHSLTDVFYDSQFNLVIRDHRGQIMLGPYVAEARAARLERNTEKNFRQAVDTLVRWTARQAVPAGTAFASEKDEKIEPPVPAPISRATTVFISSFVVDKTGAMSAQSPDDLYRHFYAAMQNWGRYKLVSSAADADLLVYLAVSEIHSQACQDPGFFPQVELRIMVPAPKVVIYGFNWRLDGRLSYAAFPENRLISLHPSQKDLQKAADGLVNQLRRLAAKDNAPASPPTAAVP